MKPSDKTKLDRDKIDYEESIWRIIRCKSYFVGIIVGGRRNVKARFNPLTYTAIFSVSVLTNVSKLSRNNEFLFSLSKHRV